MTTAQSLKVVVYGATGSQASPVVHELLRRGHRPYVVTRSAEKAAPLAAAGAEVVVADMGDRERLVAASQGMDAVALLIPFFQRARATRASTFGLTLPTTCGRAACRISSSSPRPMPRTC